MFTIIWLDISTMLYLFTAKYYIIIIHIMEIISLLFPSVCPTAYLYYTILSAAAHGHTTQCNIIMVKLYCHYCNGVQRVYRRCDSVIYNRIRHGRTGDLYCTYCIYNRGYVCALFSEKTFEKPLTFIHHRCIIEPQQGGTKQTAGQPARPAARCKACMEA